MTRRLSPISVGPVTVDMPVILAPMTGVTDMPFRTLVRRFGSGLNVTEMIASAAMIRETRQSLQKAAWHPLEEPVSMQLAGCSPREMADAARLNADRGAAIIDINMGCPVKKVVNGDAGSALMRDLPLAVRAVMQGLPFYSPRAQEALLSASPGVKVSERKTEEAVGWWVFMPPQANRQGAVQKVEEIKRLGIDEYFIVQEDPKFRFAISLGVFRTEEAARNKLEQLQGRGVRTHLVGPAMAAAAAVNGHFTDVRRLMS